MSKNLYNLVQTCTNLYKLVQTCAVSDTLNKSALTCNRDEISSQDETRPSMKKFLFTGEFHPGMKFNLKENLPLSMKTYNKTYHFSLIC